MQCITHATVSYIPVKMLVLEKTLLYFALHFGDLHGDDSPASPGAINRYGYFWIVYFHILMKMNFLLIEKGIFADTLSCPTGVLNLFVCWDQKFEIYKLHPQVLFWKFCSASHPADIFTVCRQPEQEQPRKMLTGRNWEETAGRLAEETSIKDQDKVKLVLSVCGEFLIRFVFRYSWICITSYRLIKTYWHIFGLEDIKRMQLGSSNRWKV